MLTGFDSQMLAARAKTEGIRGFCSKTQPEYIILAIETFLRGETYFPDSFMAQAG
jgi:DNA-binding NarL/FixJ family response regulator